MKFHGSLSWMRKEDRLAYRDRLPAPLTTDDKKDATKVAAKLQEYFLIFPNIRKYNESLMERTYYDLLRLYANALEKENAILVAFGFSFQDEHILDITRRALRNPTAQLALIAYNDAATASYQEKFAANRNVAVFAPRAGEQINFDAFNDLIQTVLPSIE